MGLEGATRLGYSKELAAAKEKGGVEAEDALFEVLTAEMYKHGRALSNVYGNFDIIFDHLSHIPRLYIITHTPCAIIYLVAMLIGC